MCGLRSSWANKVMHVLSSREAQATWPSIASVSAPSHPRDRGCGSDSHLEIIERIEEDRGRLWERRWVQPRPGSHSSHLVHVHSSYHSRILRTSFLPDTLRSGIRLGSPHPLFTRHLSPAKRRVGIGYRVRDEWEAMRDWNEILGR